MNKTIAGTEIDVNGRAIKAKRAETDPFAYDGEFQGGAA